MKKIGEAGEARLAERLDSWIECIAHGMTLGELPPRNFRLVEKGHDLELQKGEHIVSMDETLWVSMEEGELAFPDAAGLPSLPKDTLFPLSRYLWMRVEEGGRLKTLSTGACLTAGLAFSALEVLHQYALLHIRSRIDTSLESEQARMDSKDISERRIFQSALESRIFNRS